MLNLDDFRVELDALVASEPAASPDVTERIERLVRRRPALSRLMAVTTATVAAVAVVVAGIAVVTGNRETNAPKFQLIVSDRPHAGTALLAERFQLEVQWRSGAFARDMRGSRTVDFEAGTSIARYEPGTGETDGYAAITTPSASYHHYPRAEHEALGVTTTWIGIETTSSGAGYMGPQLPALTADAVLDHVRSGERGFYSSVTELGPELVRGMSTIHYRLVADPDRLRGELVAAGMPFEVARGIEPEATADLWVDEARLVRRTVVRNRHVWADVGVSETVTLDQEVVGYGLAVPRAERPPSGDVTWISPTELGTRFARAAWSGSLPNKQETN